MRLILCVFSVIGFLLPFTTQAQWLGSFGIESGYDDNMFRNAAAHRALSTDFSFTYGYFPTDAKYAVNYSGSVTTFPEFPEHLYSTHSLGTSGVLEYGENDVNNVTLVAAGNARIDRQDYQLYDYTQLLGSVALKHTVTGNLPLTASYRVRYRTYPHFGELSYLEHFFSLGAMTFFETRTSIRIQADLGVKNYTSHFSDATGPASGTPAPQRAGLTLDGGGPGSGNGSDGGGYGGGQMNGGPGRMGIPGSGFRNGMDPSVEYLVYDEPSTRQLSAWVNVGQSLTDNIGLRLRFLQRWNLNDRGRAFVGGAVDFIGEEELFDDPYSYESSELSITLTYLLPWSMTLRTGGYYFFKDYNYPATLDYADPFATLRNDERTGGWFRIGKRIGGAWLLFNGLDVSIGYSYLRNQSNTGYYDYSSNSLTLGIGTDF